MTQPQGQGVQKVLVVLLAIVSLCTTVLIGLTVMQRQRTAQNEAVAAGGVIHEDANDDATLPVLATLPAFSLTERNGDTLSNSDLAGKVWIASFIFTRCPDACPVMMSITYRLQEQLKKSPAWDEIRLVSITVDPEYDTPQVMAERARIAHADATHWLWLTGESDAIRDLILKGFMLGMERDGQSTEPSIIHSEKFVLVDQQGRIRGYYDGVDEHGKINGELLSGIAELTSTPLASVGSASSR